MLTLLFARFPQLGQVKTRLTAAIGKKEALQLYSNFILDELQTLKEFKKRLWICYTPADSGAAFADWLGRDLYYLKQEGSGLGQRMQSAFRAAFDAGYEQVHLLGSDIPDFPLQYLQESAQALQKGYDASICPTKDGGYCLIGFNRRGYRSKVFENIAWSGPRVFSRTMNFLDNNRQKTYILPALEDIDTFEDLKRFVKRNELGWKKLRSLELARRTIVNSGK